MHDARLELFSCVGPLQRRRGSKADPITEDDVIRAIDKLQVLGGGFSIMKVGFCTCLRSCYSMAHGTTWRRPVSLYSEIGYCAISFISALWEYHLLRSAKNTMLAFLAKHTGAATSPCALLQHGANMFAREAQGRLSSLLMRPGGRISHNADKWMSCRWVSRRWCARCLES